jgi:hypothetical protein
MSIDCDPQSVSPVFSSRNWSGAVSALELFGFGR